MERTTIVLMMKLVAKKKLMYHAREPLYSTVAAIAWWLQSTSAGKNRYLSLYISHLEVFFAVHCHLHIQLHACLTRDM